MVKQRIPGMAIAVAKGGKVLYARGFGMRNNGDRVDANTVFPIGSITKQFTAACVMLLVQDGRVRLDAPVDHYLRNAPYGSEITARELLDQTSGLPDYSAEQPAMQKLLGRSMLATVSARQLLALIARKPLHFKPGTKFEYSNTNYLIAGMVVESVSSLSYPNFSQRRIFDKLQLRHMQYLDTSVPIGPDVSVGYKYDGSKFVQLPRFTMSWARGAGALASDAVDLSAWDDAFFHGRMVDSRLVPLMTTPPRVRGEADYAFGWVNDTERGQRMIWHNGAIPGAHAMNAVFPQSSYEIVVLTNIFESAPEKIAKQIFDTLAE